MNSNHSQTGRVYVEATPLHVTVDVTPVVEANVTELLDLLDGEFFDDFIAATCAQSDGEHDGHASEALRFERLREQLVERMSTKVALTGPQAVRVAGRMHKLGLPLAEEAEHRAAVAARCEATLIAAARRHG